MNERDTALPLTALANVRHATTCDWRGSMIGPWLLELIASSLVRMTRTTCVRSKRCSWRLPGSHWAKDYGRFR